MIERCAEAGLPSPDFEERAGQFVTTIWREWLTEEVMAGLGLSDRQQIAVNYLKVNGRITNKEYKELTGVTDRTVLREFKELLAKGVLEKVGETGRGTHSVLRRKTRHKPDKRDMATSKVNGATKGLRGNAAVWAKAGTVEVIQIIEFSD